MGAATCVSGTPGNSQTPYPPARGVTLRAAPSTRFTFSFAFILPSKGDLFRLWFYFVGIENGPPRVCSPSFLSRLSTPPSGKEGVSAVWKIRMHCVVISKSAFPLVHAIKGLKWMYLCFYMTRIKPSAGDFSSRCILSGNLNTRTPAS